MSICHIVPFPLDSGRRVAPSDGGLGEEPILDDRFGDPFACQPPARRPTAAPSPQGPADGLPSVAHWFGATRLADDVTLIREPYVVPLMRSNVWHVRGRDRDLIVDSGTGVASLRAFVGEPVCERAIAVATHTHADHIGCHHEFDECFVHVLEADGLLRPSRSYNLIDDDFAATDLTTMMLPPMADGAVGGALVTALPDPAYDLSAFRLRPARSVRTLRDGDVLDLGDRVFEVLHLPGHSPGSTGLWEKATGILFAGDAVYDDSLVDNLHHSSVPDYVRSFERLRDLPVSVVHAGHDESFGRQRLLEIVETYLRKWQSASVGGEG